MKIDTNKPLAAIVAHTNTDPMQSIRVAREHNGPVLEAHAASQQIEKSHVLTMSTLKAN